MLSYPYYAYIGTTPTLFSCHPSCSYTNVWLNSYVYD